MRLYLVRHGESTSNAHLIHQDGGVELSAFGLRQAKFVAKRFHKIPTDLIIASDYSRARQTAEEIKKITKKNIVFTSLLEEVKRPSEIEGLRYDHSEAIRIKKIIREHKHNPKWHYSDEENFYDFKERCQEFARYLLKRKEKNIVVTTHGFVMRMLIGLMMFGDELVLEQYEHLLGFLELSNTGITIVEKTDAGNWKLVSWNDYAHLGE